MKQPFFNIILILTLLMVLVYPAGTVQGISPHKEPDLSVLYAAEDHIVIRLEIPDYQIVQEVISGQVYDKLSLPGAAATSEAGKPQLPVVSALIGIPPEGQVVLAFRDVKSVDVAGRYYILPAPSPAKAEGDLQPGIWQYFEDGHAYSANLNYPQSLARIVDEAWLRDQRMVRVEFFPFQWNPVGGRLIWNKTIEVEISFNGTEQAQSTHPVPFGQTDSPFEMLLKQSLLNYEQARNWRSLPQNWVNKNVLGSSFISSTSTTTDLPGPRYKIEIFEDGIYRMNYEELDSAGIDVANIDPSTFQITNQGEEIAIYVHNIDDKHVLSQGEFVLFYGEKFSGERLAAKYADEEAHWRTYDSQLPDGTYTSWTPQFNATMLEKYTDTNVYWLSVGEEPGLRMATLDGTPGTAPLPQSYRETVRAEQSHYWKTTLFTSEDTWFWDRIEVSTTNPVVTRTYTTTLNAVASGNYTATLRGEVVAATNNNSSMDDHDINVYLNDFSHTQSLVDESWDGVSRYQFEVEVPQSILLEGENQLDFVVLLNIPDMTTDSIYFDWFEIEYNREFVAEDDQIDFSLEQPGPWKFGIEGYSTQEVVVLDVINPISPTMVDGSEWLSDILTFEVNSPTAINIFADTVTELDSSQIVYYTPPSFDNEADYVLITHKNFKDDLQMLASYRESMGLRPLIVDIDDLYNQFYYGIYHPIAIKNFIRFTFEQWDQPPTYVVLVGDGHWNFKGYTSPNSYSGYDSSTIFIPPNLAWVDPWQGEVDSANLLGAVVGEDPLADVMIARLPVSNLDELNAIITKISNYENAPDQSWQRRSLFIADNFVTLSGYDPAGNFPSYADQIINEYDIPGYYSDRIYQDTYDCGAGGDCSVVNQMIKDSLNITGTLLVNYIGHGSVDRWSGEGIVTNADIHNLTNNDKLPVILSMTCLDGYWIYPGREGLIEELVRANNKGAIAGFSPTGLGVAAGHDQLHQGFYDALFVDGTWTLGVASQAAKLKLFATGMNYDLLHTFTVFGDPALKISNVYQFNADVYENVEDGNDDILTYEVSITNTSVITDAFKFMLSIDERSIFEQPSDNVTFLGPIAQDNSDSIKFVVATKSVYESNNLTDHVFANIVSQGDQDLLKSFDITLDDKSFEFSLSPSLSYLEGRVGETLSHAVVLTNLSDQTKSYDYTISGNRWSTLVLDPITIGSLDPGKSVLISLYVSIPINAGGCGNEDHAELVINLADDQNVTAKFDLHSAVQCYYIQLPSIEK